MLTIGAFARLGQVSPRMLRHYDELGLLRPERVDPTTGYRSYTVAQLARLHRLLALKDLGLTLEQIAGLLDDDPPLDELRGMLNMQRAQIEQQVGEEQRRLRRVEAHLRILETAGDMPVQDVVIKRTEPVRMAEASGWADGFGHENLLPVFQVLVPRVLEHLERLTVRAGTYIAWYEEPDDDGRVVVHAGFDIEDQEVTADELVQVVDLPVIDVASIVHRGSMDNIVAVYEAVVGWIEASGYRLEGRSRELYHEFQPDDPSANVTELQLPIAQ